MVANKGAGQDSFNPPAKAPDIEVIRAKAAAYAAKNGTSGQKSKFSVAPKKEDSGKQHRREMRQDRVKGFSFSCK